MISVNFKDNVLHIGDILRVKTQIEEGGKIRVQTFEGILISARGRGDDKTITVRRIGDRGIGVERTWPLSARNILDIGVKTKAKKVRRAKLYYLRNLTGKAAVRV